MNVENQIQHNININVPPSDWGEERRENVENLLRNIASHIYILLRTPFVANIKVIPAPIDEDPMVLYRLPNETLYTVMLSVRDSYWAQYAHQFSHEFCHIISGYDKLKNNSNNWFHEVICEIASVFTVRRMAERWTSNPLYQINPSFAVSLDDYWKKRVSCPKTQISEGISLYSWLQDHEETLRRDPYQRLKNRLVAYQLLPIFEETPEGWNAIRNFPISEGYLKEYLINWYSLVDDEDKPFVARVSDAFGFTIT